MKHLAVQQCFQDVVKNSLLTLINRVNINLYVYIPTYIYIEVAMYEFYNNK